MTADEAVQFVLHATAIGRAGDVLVLDMVEQVRIVDIARRLVADAADPVEIVYTGLRPGEKLSESLLGGNEVCERSDHSLLWHVPVMPLAPEYVTCLDPELPADGMRAALARCASEACSDVSRAVKRHRHAGGSAAG